MTVELQENLENFEITEIKSEVSGTNLIKGYCPRHGEGYFERKGSSKYFQCYRCTHPVQAGHSVDVMPGDKAFLHHR